LPPRLSIVAFTSSLLRESFPSVRIFMWVRGLSGMKNRDHTTTATALRKEQEQESQAANPWESPADAGSLQGLCQVVLGKKQEAGTPALTGQALPILCGERTPGTQTEHY
jgi:hypothetical protein